MGQVVHFKLAIQYSPCAVACFRQCTEKEYLWWSASTSSESAVRNSPANACHQTLLPEMTLLMMARSRVWMVASTFCCLASVKPTSLNLCCCWLGKLSLYFWDSTCHRWWVGLVGSCWRWATRCFQCVCLPSSTLSSFFALFIYLELTCCHGFRGHPQQYFDTRELFCPILLCLNDDHIKKLF